MSNPNSRSFQRRKVTQNKVRRVNEVNTNRINKRKYYGIGVEKREFEETLDYHVNHTAVSKAFDDSIANLNTESFRQKEQLIDDVLNSARFLRSGTDEVVNDLAPKIRDSFEKGTRRAFNSAGETLPKPENIEERVTELVDSQANYVSKLVNDLRGKARQILSEGISSGKSETEIKNELDSELKSLKDNRSETIAESETVKAAGEGTEATFDSNGVTEVMWVAEIDSKTCESGAFRVSYNGTTYTSCRELHETSFDRTGNHPVPVENSHPNCRCLLVSIE